MTSLESATPQRQRVRRSRRPTRSSPLHNPKLGRSILLVMLCLTAGFVVLSLRFADVAGRAYGAAGIDNGPNDIRYMMGPPAPGGTGGARVWHYRLAEGGSMRIYYDDANLVQRMSCEDEAMAPSACPGVLGLSLGDPETAVWYALGEPARQSYAGDVKTLSYDDIGLAFELKRFTVYKIIVMRRPSRLSFLPRAFRYMMP